jgi:hypothetical protein
MGNPTSLIDRPSDTNSLVNHHGRKCNIFDIGVYFLSSTNTKSFDPLWPKNSFIDSYFFPSMPGFRMNGLAVFFNMTPALETVLR